MTSWQGNIAKITLPTSFAVGDVNVYVVKGDALTMIDSGVRTNQSRDVLEQELKTLGLQLSDIEQVMLTHHHPDHAGGLEFLSDQCQIYGHPTNQRWLDMPESFAGQLTQFFTQLAGELGVPAEYYPKLIDYRGPGSVISTRNLSACFREGDEVPGLPEWRIIETLGHAQSHISLFREMDGVLIGGDHLLAKISPNPILEPALEPGLERPKPQLQYNASLKKLLNIPVSLVYTGHGAEINQIPEVIQSQLNRQHGRAMQVKEMLAQTPLTGLQVCMQLFPKVYKKQFGLTLSETVAQLDYLEDLGEIKHETHSGVIYYSVS